MSLLFNVFLEGLLGESCGSLAVIIFGKGSDKQQRCNQKDGLHREVWLRYETGELPGKRCYFHLEKSSLGLLVKNVTKHFFLTKSFKANPLHKADQNCEKAGTTKLLESGPTKWS